MYAIIVAGGSGTRMNTTIPKQFLTLGGKAILQYAVEAFLNAFPSIEIVVCLPQTYIELGYDVLKDLISKHNIKLVAGGETRFHSVKNGLDQLTEPGIIFVHDAVRPCIHSTFLESLYKECTQYGNAIPCLAVKDSLRKVTKDQLSIAVDRTEYKSIQTPQVFQLIELKKAFELPYQATFTDEATVMESYGVKIHLCEGLDRNIKITTPDDLPLAGLFLQQVSPIQ